MLINKLTSVFLYVCFLIDEYFRHKIVKIAMEPRGASPGGAFEPLSLQPSPYQGRA